jgi:hypothetical protein
MKKLKYFLFCCLSVVLFSSCGIASGLNMTQYPSYVPTHTEVRLLKDNFKVVGLAKGEWSATYVFGIGGLSKKALTNNAISEMYKNANLTGTQQIINITTTTSIEQWVVYTKKRAIARGYIIEFEK